jgi:outer membrane protein assembly factor BamD
MRFLSHLLLAFCVWIAFSSSAISQSDSGVDLRPKKAWWGRWGYINSAGKFVLEPQYEEALPFSDFLAPVKVEGKWGYINGEGKFIIEPRFEDAYLFSDQAAAVKEGGKWGFINRSGKFLVEPKYENAAVFRQGLAAVKWEGKWGFITKTGEMTIPPRLEQVYFFQEDRCGAFTDGKWGYIDRKGEFVIPPKYDEVLAFSEGLAAVNVGGKREGDKFSGGDWYFVSPEGKEVIQEAFVSHTAPASTAASRVGTEGRQDTTAKILGVENGFAGGKARILLGPHLMNGESKSSTWGYIDTKGNWLAQGATTIPLNFSTYTPGEGFTFESDLLGNRGSPADVLQSARTAESIGKAYEQIEAIERDADEQFAAADRVEELGDKEAAAASRQLGKERRAEAARLRKETEKRGGDSNANSLKYFEQALKIYQDFAKENPDNFRKTEAQYKTGEMLEHLARYWDAYEAYKKLVEESAANQYWDLAIERMFAIGNVFLAGQPQMLWKIPMPADMNKVVTIYESIIRSAPFGSYAPLATFSCGLAREKQKKWPEAVKFYEEVLDKYPKNDLIDDAQYQIGFVWMKAAREPQYDQTAAQKGIEAFQDYVARFKRSDKTEQAAENIEMLKQRLSGGSLSVARFYDKAGNYPAALVYYNEVLSQSPDSPQGQEAKQRKRVLEDLLTEAKQQTTPPNLSKISLRHQAEPRSVPPQ